MKLRKKKFIEKTVNLLLNILISIFGIVLLISTYTGFQTKILGNDYSNFFGYSMFEVQTGSMTGTINAGDWIIIKLTQDVELDDVVTYKLSNEYITHRIVEVYNDSYITKGDANNSKDKPITKKQIVGKVVSTLPSLGVVRKIFFNPAVLISLIITLFLLNYAIKKNNESGLKKGKDIYSLFDFIIKKSSLLFRKNREPKGGKEVKLNYDTPKAEIKKSTNEEIKKVDNENDGYEVYRDEDELDKTSFYRVISVNPTEIDKTLVEINKTKFKNEHKFWYIKIVTDKITLIANFIAKIISTFFKKTTKNTTLFIKTSIKKFFKFIILLIKTIFILIFLIIKKTCLFIFLAIKGIIMLIVIIIKKICLFIFNIFKGIYMFFIHMGRRIHSFFENVNEFREYKKTKMNTENNKEPKIVALSNNIPKVVVLNNDISNNVINPDENKTNKVEEPVISPEIIPVDVTEINKTFLEIAENEVKIAGQENKEKREEAEQQRKEEEEAKAKAEVKEEDDSLTDVNLDFLKKNVNNKNIIDTAMLIKKEELNEIIDVLDENDKTMPHETTVKEAFVMAYIDAKYYNYCGDISESNSKNSLSKIEKVIKEVALASETIYSRSKDKKDYGVVDIYTNMFMIIANIEFAKDSITDSKAKREFYKKETIKYFTSWDNKKIEYVIDEIIRIQKKYSDTMEVYLKGLETNMFNLKFNKLVTKKDMYGLTLEHDVSFSRVYSEYVIDKTYSEGIIAEDKLLVLVTLLSVQLVKDMISSNFNKKYILYMPASLYTKEKKLEKLLKMFDDKYAKENVIILITVEDLFNNKQVVREVRKNDYKFALVFDKETIVEEKDRGDMYIANCIFVNKKEVNMEKMLSFIPEELLDKVIYEDIIEKVGDFGSEE